MQVAIFVLVLSAAAYWFLVSYDISTPKDARSFIDQTTIQWLRGVTANLIGGMFTTAMVIIFTMEALVWQQKVIDRRVSMLESKFVRIEGYLKESLQGGDDNAFIDDPDVGDS